MAVNDIAVQEFVNAIKEPLQDTNKVYNATVSRIDDEGVVWVNIHGSEKETPTASTSTEVKRGDSVTVQWRNNKLYIGGNYSNPSAGVGTVMPSVDYVSELIDKDITVNRINAATGYIGELESKNIKAEDITADHAMIKELDVESMSAATAYIRDLRAEDIEAEDIVADHATVGSLDANYAHISNGVIDNAKIDQADVNDLNANYAHITNGVIDNAKIGYADVDGLNANYAHISNGTIDNAKIDQADVNNLNANYAQINLANVNNAWIENGLIKDAAISDAQILGVSANKLTAGTIDASNITVTNLNASNITTGSITVDGITIDVENNEASVDGSYIEDGTITMNGFSQEVKDVIDGAIETFTGTVVPTLNNAPASSWTTTKLKDQHIGDVYYVVNSSSQQNGYCYRFSKSGSTYSWQLIKDSDVTAALSRLTTAEGKIGDIETFDEEIATFKTETEGEISTLQTKTTSLETSLGDKVDVSTFNTLSQTVDGNSTSITTLTTTTQTLREDLDGLEIGGRNLILDTATQRVSPASVSGSAYAAPTPTLSDYGFSILNNTDDYWTYSFDYEVTGNSADTAYVYVQMKGSSIGGTHYVYIKDAPTGHFSETFKLSTTQVSSTSKSCGIRLRYATDGAVLTVKNIKLEKGNKETDWSPAPEDMEETVTTISNTVNTVSQTATTNRSHISQLTTTLGTNADGTTKAEDVMHKVSDVTQNLDEFKTTVSQTYETKSDANDVRTRLSTAETNIGQNAKAITLRATKTEAVQMSKPNLSPFFQSTPLNVSDNGEYWLMIAESFTPLEDGWAHFSRDNTSGTAVSNNYARMVACPSVFDGETYTFLIEIRNLVSNATSNNLYTQQSDKAQFWGTTEGFFIANNTMADGKYYKTATALGVSQHQSDGTRLMHINWQVPAGAKIEADIRISLYEGEYTGEYKPYVGAQMYASQAELKVANDAISLKVSQDDVINSINVSTEGITIDADKVNITGATIFTSGRLSESSLNNAYDVKDAAANALESAKGYVDGKGYQTATDVSNAVATGVSGKADKSYAVARQQRIYYRKTSSGAPSKNTTWLSTSGTGYGNWSLQIPQLTSGTTKYPYLYTAVQSQTVSQMSGTTCSCSSVLLDDTTTVIDGGNIVTGTLDASKVTVTNLSAESIESGDIAAARMKAHSIEAINSLTAGTINADRLDVGSITVGSLSDGSNYSTTTQMNTAIGDAVNEHIGGRNLILNSARKRTSSASANNSAYISPHPVISDYGLSIFDNTDDKWTCSFDYEVTGNSANAFIYILPKGSSAGTGSYVYVQDAPSGHYSYTFKLNAIQVAATGTTQSTQFRVLLRNATDGAKLSVSNMIVERGDKETHWSAAPEDYITDIDGTGIRVHTASTENNSVLVNADGVYILKGGTDKDTNSVAFYGDTARIGKESGSHLTLASDSMSMSDGNKNVFNLIQKTMYICWTHNYKGRQFTNSTDRHIDSWDTNTSISTWNSITVNYKLNNTSKTKKITSISNGVLVNDEIYVHFNYSGTIITLTYGRGSSAASSAVIKLESAVVDYVTDEKLSQLHTGIYPNTTVSGPLRVGNGTSDSERKNSLLVDWSGSGKFGGDVLAFCNSDSSGGMSLTKTEENLEICTQSNSKGEVTIDSYRVGRMVVLRIHMKLAGTTAAGQRINTISLAGKHLPKPLGNVAMSASYYGTHAIGLALTYNRSASRYELGIHNASSTAFTPESGYDLWGTLTYICDMDQVSGAIQYIDD